MNSQHLDSIVVSDPEINKNDLWGDDCFNRQSVANDLTDIVNAVGTKKPFVISVNGEWGNGKTFLLERWQQQLKKGNHRAIYFNAWADDFIPDPLVAIIGQIQEDLLKMPRKIKWQKLIYKYISMILFVLTSLLVGGFLNWLNGLLGGLLSMSLGELLSISLGGLLSVSLGRLLSVSSLGELLVSNFFDPRIRDLVNIDKLVKSFLNTGTDSTEQYQFSRKLPNELREILIRLTKKHKFPTVFIIDELDRCRPLFTIKVLERIKHLFDIPGMIFVLSINKKELGKSIRSIYGNIDSNNYLRKFTDLELNLPLVKPSVFCHLLISRMDIKDTANQEVSILKKAFDTDGLSHEFFEPMCDLMELSLRETQYSILLLRLVLEHSKKKNSNDYNAAREIFALIILKVKNPVLYLRFRNNKCDSKTVIDGLTKKFPDSRGLSSQENKQLKKCIISLEEIFYLLAKRNVDEWNNIEKDLIRLIKPGYISGEIYPYLADVTVAAGEESANHILEIVDGKKSVSLETIIGFLDLADSPKE